MGTQKNRLDETEGSFEHLKHMFKLMGKKIMQFYAKKFGLTGHMIYTWKKLILYLGQQQKHGKLPSNFLSADSFQKVSFRNIIRVSNGSRLGLIFCRS